MKGWAIDRDYLFDADESGQGYGIKSRVGYGQTLKEVEETAGQKLVRQIQMQTGLKASGIEEPVRFRLLDDDGEVYYGGAISRSWIDGPEELAFAPLVFATADAGATQMEYHYGDGEWRML